MGKGDRLRRQKSNQANEKVARSAGPSEAEILDIPVLEVRCPNTNKFVSTGVMMDVQAFNNSDMADNRFGCPECGEKHRWGDLEAVLNN